MSKPLRTTLCLLAPAAALFLFAGEAAADAIDGDWCLPMKGRHFSIRGEEIITPGGKRMNGDYQRHYFSYVIPASEPSAGQTVYMTLWDENTVHLRLGKETSDKPEVWIRCSPTTSMRENGAPPAPRG
jgi:hypothetical protein